jgi:DNA-binding PadR family transcriptional regulator
MGNLYRFVEPLILYLLKTKGAAHGYDLVDALNKHALTDSVIEPGALYRNLRRLEENENVCSYWDTTGTGPARRFYTLTPKGEEHLVEWITVMRQLSVSMKNFTDEAEKIIRPE